MCDLTNLISSETLIDLEIISQPITKVFQMLLKIVKDHNEKLKNLEQFSSTFVTKDDLQQIYKDFESSTNMLTQNIKDIQNELGSVKDDLIDLPKTLNKKLDERIEDVMITSTTAIRAVEENMNNNGVDTSAIEQLKNEVERLSSLENKFSEVYNNIDDKNNKLRQELDSKIADIRENTERLINNELEGIKSNMKKLVDTSGDGDEDPSLSKEISRLKMNFLTIRDEVNGLSNNTNEAMKVLSNTSDSLCKAFGVINEELNLLVNNNDYDLPSFNLEKFVPQFFPNGQTNYLPKISKKVKSGHIKVYRESIKPQKERNDTEVKEPEKGFAPSGLSDEQLNLIAKKVETALNINDIKALVENTRKQNDDVLSSLERKVDRDFDERLFDKFRVYMVKLGEKLNDLNNRVMDFATHEELNNVVNLVKVLTNAKKETTTALKKGPECLFCGRGRAAIQGAITPRTAKKIGTPSMAVQGSRDLIYGDGAAFVRDEFHATTMPLPPINID